MKAIAWDDEPDSYMVDLASRLGPYGIHLEIESDVAEFLRRVEAEDVWDFIVTDLLNKSPNRRGKSEQDAVKICLDLAQRFPVFMISTEADRAFTLPIPPSVIVKSKDVEPLWMAREIRDHLLSLGVPNRSRIFLSYGHDDRCRSTVRNKLANLGVPRIEEVVPADVPADVLSNVLTKMRDCAAIIALCTCDDELKNGDFSPRQNVLLEMGMALSLPRGPERLIILRQRGENPSVLPSNLGGQLVLNFDNDVSETFAALEARLRGLRLQMSLK